MAAIFPAASDTKTCPTHDSRSPKRVGSHTAINGVAGDHLATGHDHQEAALKPTKLTLHPHHH